MPALASLVAYRSYVITNRVQEFVTTVKGAQEVVKSWKQGSVEEVQPMALDGRDMPWSKQLAGVEERETETGENKP